MLEQTNNPTQPEIKTKRLPKNLGGRWLFLYWFIIAGAFSGFLYAILPRLDFFIKQATRWLPYPYFQTGSEGLILNEVSIIRNGGSIYVPLQPDLFISAPYPPLYYYLVNWIWPTGTAPTAGFSTGRAISLVSAIVAAMAIVGLVWADSGRTNHQDTKTLRKDKITWRSWRLGGSIVAFLPYLAAGIVAGLLFLSLPAVDIWASRVRADMLMTALGLIGLGLVAWKPQSWVAFTAIIPLTLAFYTKQTALAAPAACGLYLILQNWGNWRRIIFWWLGLGLAVGLPFGVLNLLTNFELYRRLFKYHNLPWKADNFLTYWSLFVDETTGLLVVAGFLVAVAALYVVMKLREDFIDTLARMPLTLWYLLASLPLLLGMGVAGADHNHFLPAEAALCAAAGVVLARTLVEEGLVLRVITLAIVGVLIWQAAVFSVPGSRYEIELRYRPQDDVALERIIENATNHPSPYILTSEAGFFVLTGKPTTYNDLFTLVALNKQGLYDDQRLLERVRSKEFGLILSKANFFTDEIRPDVWPPELVAAIRENYSLKFRDVWFTYEPK